MPGTARRGALHILKRHKCGLLRWLPEQLPASCASRLQLRSDFTELLPQDDPKLTQLRDIGDRIGPPSTLIVAIEGSDSSANERFAEALVKNLRGLIGSDLTSMSRPISQGATEPPQRLGRDRARARDREYRQAYLGRGSRGRDRLWSARPLQRSPDRQHERPADGYAPA